MTPENEQVVQPCIHYAVCKFSVSMWGGGCKLVNVCDHYLREQPSIEDVTETSTPSESKARRVRDVSEIPVEEVIVHAGIIRWLKKAGYDAIGKVIRASDDELLRIHRIGNHALGLIRDCCYFAHLPTKEELEGNVELVSALNNPSLLYVWETTFEVSVAVKNCLKRQGWYQLQEVIECTESDLLNVRGLSGARVEEIESGLAKHGLSLARE